MEEKWKSFQTLKLIMSLDLIQKQFKHSYEIKCAIEFAI